MPRFISVTFILLAGLAMTAVLVAWPRGRWDLTGGAVRIDGPGSAVDTGYSHYGLLNYLTVIEPRGSDQPGGWSVDLDPLRTGLTVAIFVAIWAMVIGVIQ